MFDFFLVIHTDYIGYLNAFICMSFCMSSHETITCDHNGLKVTHWYSTVVPQSQNKFKKSRSQDHECKNKLRAIKWKNCGLERHQTQWSGSAE